MKRRAFLLGATAALAGCAQRNSPPLQAAPGEVEALARGLAAMSPAIDPAEARAAAKLAYAETYRLAQAYEIEDPPLVHNSKVNWGLKPRGLCWHWAEDIETRLKAANYRTFRIHRAIANYDNPLRIDHSTAIIAAADADWHDGMVLDPWRNGGELFWARVREDPNYVWGERRAVLRRKRHIRAARLAVSD